MASSANDMQVNKQQRVGVTPNRAQVISIRVVGIVTKGENKNLLKQLPSIHFLPLFNLCYEIENPRIV